MEFLVIAYSFLAFILIVLLASPAGQRMDKKQKRIERINNSVGQPVYKELELSFYERFLGKGIKGISSKISKFLPQKKNANKTKTLEAIRKQLRCILLLHQSIFDQEQPILYQPRNTNTWSRNKE